MCTPSPRSTLKRVKDIVLVSGEYIISVDHLKDLTYHKGQIVRVNRLGKLEKEVVKGVFKIIRTIE